MAKRCLIVSYYFPPAGGAGVQRWVKFIKYLSQWNWQFTVITSEIEKSFPVDTSLLQELPQTFKLIRTVNPKSTNPLVNFFFSYFNKGYPQRWLSAFYYITDSRKSWNDLARKAVNKALNENTYDVIIFTIPPYLLAELAANFTTTQDIPVLLDMRDHWTTNPLKIHPTAIHKYIDKKHEKKALSHIKYIITVCHSILEHISEESTADTLVITNGYDEEDFTNLKTLDLKEKGDFNLGFSGTIYSHLNSPKTLFSAIKSLKDDGLEIHFHHVGESAYNIKNLARKYGLQNQYHAWGYQEHKTCLQILQAMDANCQILDERVVYADKTVGSKLYEYLRLRKPILAMVPANGEVARIIKETHSGVVCSSYNIDEICVALKEIVKYPNQYTFKDIEQYNRQRQSLKLKSFLEEKVIKVKIR